MTMNDARALRDILSDQAEAKGLTAADVAKKAGAPEHYVVALFAGEKKSLPALPYMRQYLAKIADVLGLPADAVIGKFKEECAAMHSGSFDTLPGNRFALPSYRKHYSIGIIVMVAIIVIGVIARSGFFGQPSLSVTMPESDTEPFIAASSTITLAGRLSPGDTLLINGEHVAAQGDGSFSTDFELLPELNSIEFIARRFLGRQVVVRRQVYYEPSQPATTTVRIVVPALEDDSVSTTEEGAN